MAGSRTGLGTAVLALRQLLWVVKPMLSTLGPSLLALLALLLLWLARTALAGLRRTSLGSLTLLWLLHSHHLTVGAYHHVKVTLAVKITLKGRGPVGINQRRRLVGELGSDSSAIANVADNRTRTGTLELAAHSVARICARCSSLALSSRLALLLLLARHH